MPPAKTTTTTFPSSDLTTRPSQQQPPLPPPPPLSPIEGPVNSTRTKTWSWTYVSFQPNIDDRITKVVTKEITELSSTTKPVVPIATTTTTADMIIPTITTIKSTATTDVTIDTYELGPVRSKFAQIRRTAIEKLCTYFSKKYNEKSNPN